MTRESPEPDDTDDTDEAVDWLHTVGAGLASGLTPSLDVEGRLHRIMGDAYQPPADPSSADDPAEPEQVPPSRPPRFGRSGRFGDHLGPRLGALVDGELAHGDRDRALFHISICSWCRTLVEDERRLKSQLSSLPMPEPSAHLLASLRDIPDVHQQQSRPSDNGPLPGGFLRSRTAAFLPGPHAGNETSGAAREDMEEHR